MSADALKYDNLGIVPDATIQSLWRESSAHRWLPQKMPVMRKEFPYHVVIMIIGYSAEFQICYLRAFSVV